MSKELRDKIAEIMAFAKHVEQPQPATMPIIAVVGDLIVRGNIHISRPNARGKRRRDADKPPAD